MAYVFNLDPLPGGITTGGRVQIDIPDLTTATGWKTYWYLPTGTGGGSDTFIGLTDVPASFTGSGTYIVRVNGTETALEFVELSTLETDPVFSAWLIATPPAYPGDIPSIAGLLDETAHDLLDHTGLTGVGTGDMTLAGIQSVTGLKTFDKTKIAIKGTSTGTNIVDVANASATDYTNVIPAKSGTFAMTNDIANSRLESYSTTATAGATTTLTVASNYMQYFTGTLTQIVQMPVVSTLVLGFQFKICNKSTGLITVNSSGSNLICLVPLGMEVILTCIAITGTDAASWSVEFKLPALTSTKVWMGNGSNVPTETETESAALTVSNYTVDFPELAEESNWVDNVTNIISGVIGDRAVGIDELGSVSESMYTQYGWTRDFINSFITDATLIAALQTSGNWTKVTDVISTYNAAKGDRNQTYYNNGYFYFCYGTASHTWLRYGNLDTITATDINYLPKPQIEVGKGHGDFFTIDAKYDITNIIVEAETTTAGNLTIGSTGTQEIASLAVTAACSVNGNAQVVLDGVTFNVPLTTAQNSTTLVATELRAFSYAGWTTGGTGTTVTFTCNKYKTCTDATYSANGTGATGTMTTGTQGVDPNNDIVTSIALPTTIGQKKRLTYLVNVDFPTASNRSMYINISSAATIKLHLITQKMFE